MKDNGGIGATGATGKRGRDVGAQSNIVKYVQQRMVEVEQTVMDEKDKIDQEIDQLNRRVQGTVLFWLFYPVETLSGLILFSVPIKVLYIFILLSFPSKVQILTDTYFIVISVYYIVMSHLTNY